MNKTIENIVALCKRRGFIFQSSSIYGGFAAIYDYGPLGIELKNQILMLEILQKKKQKEILILLLQLPPCKLSQVAN